MKIRSYIKEIEKELQVSKLIHKEMHYWLLLKNYIITEKFYKKNSTSSELGIQQLLPYLFVGLKNILTIKKFDYFFFSDSKERRDIEGIFTDKLCDYPANLLKKSLLIEKPLPFLHQSVASKNRISRLPIYLLEVLFTKLQKSPDIPKEISSFIQKNNLRVNPSHVAKKMYAQYITMKWILKLHQPKAVFFICSYTDFGYIKALKEKGVKVIELQHGVITEDHYGYNTFTDFPKTYFPDNLLTFGLREKNVFSSPNKWHTQNIPVGSFYIDYINTGDLSHLVIPKSPFIIAVSLQDCEIGNQVPEFIIAVANKNPDFLFLMIPRSTPKNTYKENYSFPSNVQFPEMNVYEAIKIAHFHCTAYSSCILEAPALGKLNIAINIENRAKEYYSTTFGHLPLIKYTTKQDEFASYIRTTEIDSNKIMDLHKEIVIPNYKKNIKNALESLNLVNHV